MNIDSVIQQPNTTLPSIQSIFDLEMRSHFSNVSIRECIEADSQESVVIKSLAWCHPDR